MHIEIITKNIIQEPIMECQMQQYHKTKLKLFYNII